MSDRDVSFPSARTTFDAIERELGVGMVPRIFLLLEGRPDVLAHIWGQFHAVVLTGAVPRMVKEMIGTVVATATHCEYVRAVHFHSLTLQGADPHALAAVRSGSYDAPSLPRLTRSALRFAAQAAATRTAQDGDAAARPWEAGRIAAMQELGAVDWSAEEQFELLATVALFEQICTIANLLDLDPGQP